MIFSDLGVGEKEPLSPNTLLPAHWCIKPLSIQINPGFNVQCLCWVVLLLGVLVVAVGWTSVFLLNLYVETLILGVMVFGNEAFRK